MVSLRPWQANCIQKTLDWYAAGNKHFLVNAAPGAGKTIAACVIAQKLFEAELIDSVVLIAPRKAVVDQWVGDFKVITGRRMLKITAADEEPEDYGTNFAATWSAVQGLLPAFQSICNGKRALVICDEHHHAAIEAAWGTGAFGAFSNANFVLVLTGTPIRSDGKESAWLAYDDQGAINHPEAGTYTISYGEAVDSGYCRPITFHRHEGHFTVDLGDEGTGQVTVCSKTKPELPGNLKNLKSLKKALDFYKLVCTPAFDPNGLPSISSYHGSMLQWGSEKLDDIICELPKAGGLVIAPDIEFAEYMADLIEQIEGEKPTIVHSNLANSEARIDAFRESNKRWIVSVGMISEGVDIPRLRILIYLPNARTELAFRQAMGRVVRNTSESDKTRAYVVMPTHDQFENFARNVEQEMSPSFKSEAQKPKTKMCPICDTECERSAVECECCGHQFSNKAPAQKACASCGGLNSPSAKSCIHCGDSFEDTFSISLKQALRLGVIARGIELNEDEVQMGEKMATSVRAGALSSGDENLIKIIRILPEEAYGRLAKILNDSLNT